MLQAEDVRQKILNLPQGQHRIHCPECVRTRRNKREETLSVQIDGGTFLWNCWHCAQNGSGWLFGGGAAGNSDGQPHQVVSVRQPLVTALRDLSESGSAFLTARGLSPELAAKHGVKSCTRYFKELGREAEAIAFVHQDKKGETLSVKFRALEGKHFSSSGTQSTYWGLEYVGDTGPLVITEGELDALACLSAKIQNAISVPSGAASGRANPNRPESATAALGGSDQSSGGRYGFIVSAAALYDKLGKVVIFTDGDEPGRALGEELARRIGKYRCYNAVPPLDCKDANDVLQKYGPDKLRECVDAARPWPVAGLYDANHYSEKIHDLHAHGLGKGLSTGLSSVDSLYTVVPGQVSIVTGIPSSGKSEFVDQLTVNLAMREGWSFCMSSMENPPQLHLAKLIEKMQGKPFFEHVLPRLTTEEVEEGMLWCQKHYSFIEAADGQPQTIDSILEKAKIAVMRLGCRGLVIDPYNYIEKPRGDMSETEYVSDLVTKIKRFSVGHDVHTWFVAHPAKLQRGENGKSPIPNGYDISGSAHFYNKADVGITVHRTYENQQTIIRIWKCRFKWVGQNGDALLNYDLPTGRYSDGRKEDETEEGGDRPWYD